MDDDLIGRCAAGEAAWHAGAHAALGAARRRPPSLAWAPAGTPHRYLFGAVTLARKPMLPPPLVRGFSGAVCDSWASLTPADLPGWTSSIADPWMARGPGTSVVPAVPGGSVERTADALLFEDTAFRAAGGSPPMRPGELHPAGSGSVPGLPLFLARRDGFAVGTALAVRHHRGVMVSAVNVFEAEPGRGLGSRRTAAAVNVDPGMPATLTASQLGIALYRRQGFHELEPALHWRPREQGR